VTGCCRLPPPIRFQSVFSSQVYAFPLFQSYFPGRYFIYYLLLFFSPQAGRCRWFFPITFRTKYYIYIILIWSFPPARNFLHTDNIMLSPSSQTNRPISPIDRLRQVNDVKISISYTHAHAIIILRITRRRRVWVGGTYSYFFDFIIINSYTPIHLIVRISGRSVYVIIMVHIIPCV